MYPEHKELSQEEFDKNIDQVLGIVQRNYEEKRNQRMTDEMLAFVNANYENARRKSRPTEQSRKYQTKTKKKAKNTKRNCIIAIVATAVIIATSVGLVNSAKNIQARIEFTETISEHVDDNVNYLNYQLDEYGRPMWYYDSMAEIARETIDEHLEVDIDTRIYGTYIGLKNYQRDENMDKVMREMQKIVEANPLEYDENVVRACNHNSFTDYLASLNIDKKTYLAIMRDITTAYGNNDLDKVQELLTSLNGGDR